MVTPQPISKGPGRRGGASASSGGGGGRAGSEHPAAADLRAGTWRPSGPPRSLPCRFSWPWRASRRWRGAWPRAVRVSDGWSGGSGRAGAAASALQDGAELGGGGARPPDPAASGDPGPEVPAGGEGCRGGTSADPAPPSLSPPQRSAEPGAGTQVRGLALSPTGPGIPGHPLSPHQTRGSAPQKREMPSPPIVARVGRVWEVQPAHRRPDPLLWPDPGRVPTGRPRAGGERGRAQVPEEKGPSLLSRWRCGRRAPTGHAKAEPSASLAPWGLAGWSRVLDRGSFRFWLRGSYTTGGEESGQGFRS